MSNNRNEFVNSLKVDNRRKVKNQPSNKKYTPAKGMNKKIAAAMLAVGLTVLGMAACKPENKTNDVNQNSTITYTVTLNQEEKLETSVKKAENDFLTRYLKAYNKENDTDYMPYEAELVTNSIEEGVVYVVDDKLVTFGQYPALVKQELSKYGNVKTEDGHDKVMQILINREDDIIVLGTYDSKTLQAIHSGTQIDNLDNLDENLFELEDLGISKELSKSICELSAAKGVETEQSIKQRINKYNKAKELEDKGYEIGD